MNTALAEINNSIGELAYLLENNGKSRRKSRLSGAAALATQNPGHSGAIVEASVGFLRVKEVHDSFSAIVKQARSSWSGAESQNEADNSTHTSKDEGSKRWNPVEIPVRQATPPPSHPSIALLSCSSQLVDAARAQATYRSHWTKPAVRTPTKDKQASREHDASHNTSSKSIAEASFAVLNSFAKDTSSSIHDLSAIASNHITAPDVSVASFHHVSAPDVSEASSQSMVHQSMQRSGASETRSDRSESRSAMRVEQQCAEQQVASAPISVGDTHAAMRYRQAAQQAAEEHRQRHELSSLHEASEHNLTIQTLLDRGVGEEEDSLLGEREEARQRLEREEEELAGERAARASSMESLSCDLSNTCSVTERSVNASDTQPKPRDAGVDFGAVQQTQPMLMVQGARCVFPAGVCVCSAVRALVLM